MGTTRRGNYATDPATAATGSEAPLIQVTPPAAAAAGVDDASPMEAAAAPMVNADDAGHYSASSSDEEREGFNRTLDGLIKVARGGRMKKHARNQVALPAGTQVNVTHIYAYCCNRNTDDSMCVWEHIGYTEVPPLPHTATSRFKITDDLSKAYANIAAGAKDLAVSKPAADADSRIVAFYCDPNTVESQEAAIRRPPPTSDGPNAVSSLKLTRPAHVV